MQEFYLTADLTFSDPTNATDDAFEEFLDRLMGELGSLEAVDQGIFDSDLGASLTERTVRVNMGIEADTVADAGRLFLANIRTALHAAGCFTPGWPTFKPPERLPEPRQVDSIPA